MASRTYSTTQKRDPGRAYSSDRKTSRPSDSSIDSILEELKAYSRSGKFYAAEEKNVSRPSTLISFEDQRHAHRTFTDSEVRNIFSIAKKADSRTIDREVDEEIAHVRSQAGTASAYGRDLTADDSEWKSVAAGMKKRRLAGMSCSYKSDSGVTSYKELMAVAEQRGFSSDTIRLAVASNAYSGDKGFAAKNLHKFFQYSFGGLIAGFLCYATSGKVSPMVVPAVVAIDDVLQIAGCYRKKYAVSEAFEDDAGTAAGETVGLIAGAMLAKLLLHK